MKRIVLHDDAERELDDAIAYLETARDYSGLNFLDAVETAFERLLQFPRLGKQVGPNVRRLVMWHWHYNIIYSIEEYGIYVHAIAHQSRRGDYWAGRIR